MIASASGQSISNLTLVAPAYADDDDDEVALNCPDGITTCYSADGTEYTDVNNLAATAAGSEGEDDDGEALVSVVEPAHYRSF